MIIIEKADNYVRAFRKRFLIKKRVGSLKYRIQFHTLVIEEFKYQSLEVGISLIQAITKNNNNIEGIGGIITEEQNEVVDKLCENTVENHTTTADLRWDIQEVYNTLSKLEVRIVDKKDHNLGYIIMTTDKRDEWDRADGLKDNARLLRIVNESGISGIGTILFQEGKKWAKLRKYDYIRIQASWGSPLFYHKMGCIPESDYDKKRIENNEAVDSMRMVMYL